MTASRMKILCVRARPNVASAAIHNAVIDEWVGALALHCDVETIEQDFDLVEVYERVKPDLLLFDSINWGRRHRLNIANIDAYPDLPRALFANNDPHDPMRPLMMDMLPTYGIDTIFCMGHEALEQMNELRRFNCFVLPKFVDSGVFRDYGEAKSIPVAIMSAHLFPTFYPWRAQVTQEIQHILPTLLYTHPGYANGGHNPFAIQGESYARMLSRSQFCVSDTTVLDYVVRKHLEIPAAGSVLVSPECEALSDYGFVDMENCLLGPAGAELYKKIVAVARDPQLYEQIRANGHALVHARYTRQAWTHILDWYACRRALKPGEKVQQEGVFGRFKAVPDIAQVPTIADFTVRDNPMAVRLRAAREALLSGSDLAPAVDGLREVMSWVGHVGEPWFMMGVISFALGDLDNARTWLLQRCGAQGQEDASLGLLDPCEIAWLMLVAYLTADDVLLRQMSHAAATTSHLSIRRVQWLIDGGAPVADIAEAGLDRPRPDDRLSIHWLGDEDFDAWFGLIHAGLSAHAGAAQAA
ncbi:glycosyltransferase [Novosphingobium sp. G106]|uniref:glycosyltransferase n=1 Tax=Novosphingobium sp. G106 TaxID=2849500 RepID=UPI001C2CE15D|nr:glycosyltransferase [Novosphingobium sp. G106]MBV1691287.1 glycosyltransferase [Novosphingobium sp. G106]